jgi:hypothetical protein
MFLTTTLLLHRQLQAQVLLLKVAHLHHQTLIVELKALVQILFNRFQVVQTHHPPPQATILHQLIAHHHNPWTPKQLL